MDWSGVLPAITTPFNKDLTVDHGFLAEHCAWLLSNGCRGIVPLGSLGEGATLSTDEKLAVLRTCVQTSGGKAPVVATVSSLRTDHAAEFASAAQEAGCSGLMVLPPYVYRGDWREMKAHVASVLRATPLPVMLYNNPIAYGTDFTPENIAELAMEHGNLKAVKESSADVRRVSAIRALVGDRLAICVGVDDAILEGIGVGATGWVAGLVNAFPAESVALLEAGIKGDRKRAEALYRWFLPLLRMDTVPKFVQLIKLVQQEVGMGSERVRPPRLEMAGSERDEALATLKAALANRPAV
ncbi:MAG TPA: dihydrodipicolinate synthase family protein [Terriglobales bacterium]|nr:dihydrodipicolinate synthase family protein [Terriglobales bacterium]